MVVCCIDKKIYIITQMTIYSLPNIIPAILDALPDTTQHSNDNLAYPINLTCIPLKII